MQRRLSGRLWGRSWVRGAAVAFAALLAVGSLGAGPAGAVPPKIPDGHGPQRQSLDKSAFDKLGANGPRLLESASTPMTVFVQLAGDGAADVSAKAQGQGRGQLRAQGDAKTRVAQVRATARSVTAQAKRVDGGAVELFTTSNSVPGVGLRTTGDALRDIAARSDVAKITPITRKTVNNAASGALIKALATWQQTGNTGKGVRIGIIDTGIDYTHADFGGEGTAAAYEAAHQTADSGDPWKPTAKVVGGWDFVGDDYDPESDDQSNWVPRPDPNPLDCDGHGTHVAGTAAGFGVTAAGRTYTGSYRSLTAAQLRGMRIGPGMAPQASLYALRVFGCEGSTDVVLPALDRALDPNGDGNFKDHLDVVNLSLGSDFGGADDPENAVIDKLAKHGVLSVIASGNSSDVTDIGGSPGNAARSLTVANSVDGFSQLDQLKVDAPAGVAGNVPVQFSIAYPWQKSTPTSGSVVQLSDPANLDGCSALSSDDQARVAGKVAWLEWDDQDATRRCGSAGRSANVKAAGAIGAIFTSGLDAFSAGITGDDGIPVVQLTKSGTSKLRPAATAGTLQVTFDRALALSLSVTDPRVVDTLDASSSRNSHGAPGVVKPDVTAPGNTILSAGSGTGNLGASETGTSMATPHIAGVAALVKKAHPSWSAEQLKAAVMNTAVHDLYTGPNKTGKKYGPARVGAGRTDARYAVKTTLLAYSKTKPGVVSASFGVVEAPITSRTVTRKQQITVQNTAASKRKVTLSYSPVTKQPGVSYTLSKKKITLKARSKTTVTVTMTVRPSALRRTLESTMSATTVSELTGERGRRQFVSAASGHLLVKRSGDPALRVPVYGAAKPVSATTVAATRTGPTAVLKVSGSGIAQGSGSQAYQSIGSPLVLGSSSRKLPTCAVRQVTDCVLNSTARGVDLQYTGLASLPSDDLGWFGFSAWGNWPTMSVGGNEVDFEVDTDGDGKADYTVLYWGGGSDQPMSVVLDSDGDPFAVYPINFADGSMDTNAYDTNVAVLPFSLSDLGAPEGANSYPIRYRTVAYSAYGNPQTGLVDSTDWVAADLVKPVATFADPLFADRNKATVKYAFDPGTPAKALVLHLHGKSGQRAQVVTLR